MNEIQGVRNTRFPAGWGPGVGSHKWHGTRPPTPAVLVQNHSAISSQIGAVAASASSARAGRRL